MAYTRTSVVISVFAAACLMSTGAGAATQSKCLVGKNKCMSKKAGSLLKCEQKAETPGKPPDPNFADCEDKAKGKFDGGSDPTKGCFEKLENKSNNDCITFDDTASAEAAVDACVDEIVAAIDPAPVTQTKCGVKKKKCVAKKLSSVLKCYQKAETPGKPMDPNTSDCITKATAKYDGGTDPSKGCFVKLESKSGNDCQPPIGNQAQLEDIVDSCVGAFVTLINTPTSTTTSTTSTTTSTTSSTTTSTTTSTTSSTTTSTTTTTTSSTTTTTSSASPSFLDFTVTAGGGTCGDTKDGSSVVIKTLGCGGLDIGAGASLIPEGPTPDGSQSRFTLSCAGPSCTIGPTSAAPPVDTAGPDCTDVGCNFGTPLPIPNPTIPGITTCVLNTWNAAASGTLDLSTGTSSTNVPLISDTYLTGNLAQPCPKCSATGTPASPGSGTCDRGPRAGMACMTTSSTGYTRDCPTGGADGGHPCTPGGGACIDGSHVGPINVNLSPLTTGTASMTNATGNFCPGQSNASGHLFGCFGSAACQTITENGSPAGAITQGTPADATLASVFCIAATGNGLVDASADLPGPGAVSLPGQFLVSGSAP
jgi:hypothetical protein